MGLAVAGCVHTHFTRTTGLVVPARAPHCHLDVVFQGAPSDPYVVLGGVATNSSAPALLVFGETDVAAMRRLTEQACTVGAQGLMNVALNTQLVWAGRGRWKSTAGTAWAFIYVDPLGRPLAPHQ